MPYLLLIIGLMIGAYALFRFFAKAKPDQVKALFLTFFAAVVAITLLFMALTGRLIPAIGLLAVLLPIYMNMRKTMRASENNDAERFTDAPMDKRQALKILGLEQGASEAEIKDAYKNLMRKFHPDREGSEWMAAKLNEAKDYLLK